VQGVKPADISEIMKKEYMNVKINEPAMNTEDKNIRHLCKGIN
jgi:hypothetical protein